MCDTFCVRSAEGMLIAKSSDRPVGEVQLLEWLTPRSAPGSGAAAGGAGRADGPTVRTTHIAVPDAGAVGVLGSRPTWMWGLEHGVNEHGVAIGNEKVWTVDDPRAAPPSLLGMDLVRLGLERGRSADDALDVVTSLLEAHGQGGSGEEHHDEPYWSSFLLVDGDGGWVLETSNRSWVARPVGEATAISNRLTIGTDWTCSSPDVAAGADWDAWRDPAAPTGIADHRLAATRACVGRGPGVTPADAVATLRDHGTGPWGPPRAPDRGTPAIGFPEAMPPAPPEDVRDDWSGVTICMHVRDYQCTAASMVVQLPGGRDPSGGSSGAPIRVWASLGNACTGVFLPVAVKPGQAGAAVGARSSDDGGVVAVVPEVLHDAAAWAAFNALGRAVEAVDGAGSSALARIREVLGPIEAAAWGEADDLWSTDAGPDRWQVATARWTTEVRAALTALATMDAVEQTRH
jgi:hypothetical protein